MKRVFYSRGMDGLDAGEMLVKQDRVVKELAGLDMMICNPLIIDDNRRKCISGIDEIVIDDIEKLKSSDFLIVDLSLPGRSYVGAIFEMSIAYNLGKSIYCWVGDTENCDRIWLQHHATSITRTFQETKELLYFLYTSEGIEENKRNIIKYYDSIFLSYAYKEKKIENYSEESLQQSNLEHSELQRWMETLEFNGTLVDIGCGTCQWNPVLLRKIDRLFAFDASDKMISYSKGSNTFSNVNFMVGDYFDFDWMEKQFRSIGGIDFFFLGFILNLMTENQQEAFLRHLRSFASKSSRIVIVDNQSSLFSPTSFFSRTEVQRRRTDEGYFSMCKRNFLKPDIEKALKQFGRIDDTFCTRNYFVGGIASI